MATQTIQEEDLAKLIKVSCLTLAMALLRPSPRKLLQFLSFSSRISMIVSFAPSWFSLSYDIGLASAGVN